MLIIDGLRLILFSHYYCPAIESIWNFIFFTLIAQGLQCNVFSVVLKRHHWECDIVDSFMIDLFKHMCLSLMSDTKKFYSKIKTVNRKCNYFHQQYCNSILYENAHK